MIQLIDYLKERQKGVRYILFGIFAATFLWSITVDTSHAHTWVEKHIPGFWSLFGIVSCIVLIFIARWLAQAGIAREDGYYDN